MYSYNHTLIAIDRQILFLCEYFPRHFCSIFRYGNQRYVLYNISCPPGHQAFFNMINIDLEKPNCMRNEGTSESEEEDLL